jgi:hypothetical protein
MILLNNFKEKYFISLIKFKKKEIKNVGKEQIYRLKKKKKNTPQCYSNLLLRSYIRTEREIKKKLQIYVTYNRSNVYFNAFFLKKAITNKNLGKRKLRNKAQKLTLANYKETLELFLKKLTKKAKKYIREEKKRLKLKLIQKLQNLRRRKKNKITKDIYLKIKKEKLKNIKNIMVQGIIRIRGKPYKKQIKLLTKSFRHNKEIKLEWIENYNPMIYRSGIREKKLRRV